MGLDNESKEILHPETLGRMLLYGEILPHDLFQGGVEKLAAAIKFVDYAVSEEGVEAAAAEAQGEIGTGEACIVLPEAEIVGSGVICHPVLQ